VSVTRKIKGKKWLCDQEDMEELRYGQGGKGRHE